MLWMLMGAALAGEPEVVEAPAGPSLLDQARLSRLWLTSDDDGIAQDAQRLERTIADYSARAERVFIGEVVGVYHPGGQAIRGTQVSLVVSEVIRGKVPSVVEIHIPPPGAYIAGDPETAPVSPERGFQVLVFTDADGEAITSNALFLIDGGFIWRNKAPDVVLNPRAQGDWDLKDPSRDYLVASLSAVKQQLASR
jgi:hypothetical protein